MKRDHTIRLYRSGDEEGIMTLREETFGVSMSPREWEWKYTGFPSGSSIIVVTVVNDRIVGHAAYIPCRVSIDGSPVRAVTSVDAMVAADQRGKGLFLQMEKFLNERFSASDASVLFSFANPASGRILISNAVRHKICEVESLTSIIRPLTALVNRLRVKVTRGGCFGKTGQGVDMPPFGKTRIGETTFEETSEITTELDSLWLDVCPAHRVSVWRDTEYLKWRYFDHPTRSYRVVLLRTTEGLSGYFVLGTLDVGFRKGFLVDLVLRDEREDIVEKVINLTVDYFRRAGIESVSTWLPGHSRVFPAFRRSGFSTREARVTITGNCLDRTLENVYLDGGNWYYTAGDTDVL